MANRQPTQSDKRNDGNYQLETGDDVAFQERMKEVMRVKPAKPDKSLAGKFKEAGKAAEADPDAKRWKERLKKAGDREAGG